MGTNSGAASTILFSTTLIVSLIAGATLFGAAVPVAAEHPDDAPDLTDNANFDIVLPSSTDHLPGDQNEENGSIEYFASGADAFKEVGAQDGVWINYVIIDASWIDYTACKTENTQAFGLDRGNNNSGTEVDEDLIEHQKKVDFRDDGITINFFDWSDFAGDPPYIAPEDAIVAAQGAGSNAGPCLTLTSEPGWYQIEGFINGSAANGDCTEEGNSQCEPEGNEEKGFTLNSNYTYVCECENEEEAEQKLGPKPGSDGDSSTPTPSGATATATSTPATGTSTATPTDGGGEQTATATGTDESTATATQANNGGGNNGGGTTPSAGGGPGFGALVAIAGLLGSALLLYRRR